MTISMTGLTTQCVRVNGTDDDVGIESTGQGRTYDLSLLFKPLDSFSAHLDRNLSFKEGDNTLMPLSRTPTESSSRSVSANQ
jgi:hypothetical protein